MNIFERVKQIGVVPVIALDDVSLAADLANALCDGGLPVAEITFRVANAPEVMRAMKEARPEITIGAGTVLKLEQIDAAVEAGSEFIVAPGINPKTAERCNELQIPYIPGVATPSEVELAGNYGCKFLKFFPAELNGGLAYIKAMCAAYRDVEFMPTGGVKPENLATYLEYEKIYAAGGTWIAKTDMIKNREFDKIKALAKEAAEIRDKARSAN